MWAPRDRHEVHDVISRPAIEPSRHSPGGSVDTSWPETLSRARVVTVQFATYGGYHTGDAMPILSLLTEYDMQVSRVYEY